MVAKKTKKAVAPVSTLAVPAPTFRLLKPFHHLAAEEGTFGFARFYWTEGDGHRQSILPNFRKKRRPVDQGEEDTAARVEVLLPSDAPEEYSDADFLVKRFEEKLPVEETTAYAQVTLRFPDARNVHHPYETARAWVRSFYVDDPKKAAPVVLVLHTPHLAGSDAPLHVHALILPRQLRWYGWAKKIEIASDDAKAQAQESWKEFRKNRL